MKVLRLAAFLLTGCWAGVAIGYEIETHGAIAKHTYSKSVLISGLTSTLFEEMGVEEWLLADQIAAPFGNVYYDVFDSNIIQRDVFEGHEGLIIEKLLGVPPLSIQGWLMRGAIREDDVVADVVTNGPCNISEDKNPQDDPYPDPPNRPINHFYDPIHNRGLNQIVLGDKATDWALGVGNALAEPLVEDAGRRNHFTLLDAREAQYRALTGRKGSDPTDPNYPIVANADQIGHGGAVATRTIRDAYWATMFRSLGDVLHLIQDMGQPQHTRNDTHLDECEPFKFLENKSIYEAYVNARALSLFFYLPSGTPVPTKDLLYDTYSFPVVFNDAVSYFTTRHKDSQILDRRGLADYSNRGFFSAGTNLDQVSTTPEYDYPENNFPSYGQATKSENWAEKPLKNNGQVTLLTHTVPDSLPNGQTINDVPLTTYGVFDHFLEDSGYFKRYSLNRYNYDAMADLLIPRAVAYGAGLLDYFFRGRLDISLPPEGIYGIINHTESHVVINSIPEKDDPEDEGVFGFEKIILSISNTTPDIDDGQFPPFAQDIGAGTFRAVAHYRLNPCYTPDLSGEANDAVSGILNCDTSTITAQSNVELIATSEVVAISSFNNSGTNRIEFDFSAEPIPVNAVDLKIQVVYYGELGTEAQAIAVGMKDISEPSYYLTWNASDYFSLYSTIYKTDDPAFITAAQNEGISPAQYAAYSTGPGTLTVGNAAGVVQTPAFNPGGYLRIAYLADYDPISLLSYIPPISGASFLFQPRRVSIDENNALTFHVIGSVGDTTNRIYGNSIFNMTHQEYPVGSQYGSFTNISNFPVPEKKQVTVCFPPVSCP